MNFIGRNAFFLLNAQVKNFSLYFFLSFLKEAEENMLLKVISFWCGKTYGKDNNSPIFPPSFQSLSCSDRQAVPLSATGHLAFQRRLSFPVASDRDADGESALLLGRHFFRHAAGARRAAGGNDALAGDRGRHAGAVVAADPRVLVGRSPADSFSPRRILLRFRLLLLPSMPIHETFLPRPSTPHLHHPHFHPRWRSVSTTSTTTAGCGK